MPEDKDIPARVTLMQLPTRQEIRVRNLFNVVDCKLHWQKNGDYLCVKVDRTPGGLIGGKNHIPGVQLSLGRRGSGHGFFWFTLKTFFRPTWHQKLAVASWLEPVIIFQQRSVILSYKPSGCCVT